MINFWSSTKKNSPAQNILVTTQNSICLPGPEVVAAFESETDVVTVDLFRADAKTEVVESFERSKP